jgi:ATP-binding cassette subfamily F protein uup
MTPIFYIKDGNLSFADKIILSNIELYLSPGDRVCLVGKNGCGKSSLMKIIEGEYELDGVHKYIIELGDFVNKIAINTRLVFCPFIRGNSCS